MLRGILRLTRAKSSLARAPPPSAELDALAPILSQLSLPLDPLGPTITWQERRKSFLLTAPIEPSSEVTVEATGPHSLLLCIDSLKEDSSISSWSFAERVLNLPRNANAHAASARLDNGTLSLIVPKFHSIRVVSGAGCGVWGVCVRVRRGVLPTGERHKPSLPPPPPRRGCARRTGGSRSPGCGKHAWRSGGKRAWRTAGRFPRARRAGGRRPSLPHGGEEAGLGNPPPCYPRDPSHQK